ncbi:MAG: hypothetical protein ACFE9R_12000, partial [Candidatus Hermodarchaeota archaeon]
GLLRLENVRLKQDLEETKKNPILLPVIEDKNQSTDSKPPVMEELGKDSDQVEDNFKKIMIICPECEHQKYLKVPIKLINQSSNVTTISVPSGIVCSHNFQVFVDKFFDIRGYQLADFEFTKLEFYEGKIGVQEQRDPHDHTLASSPKFQEVINLLRNVLMIGKYLGVLSLLLRVKFYILQSLKRLYLIQ